jgi:hypothetical protein
MTQSTGYVAYVPDYLCAQNVLAYTHYLNNMMLTTNLARWFMASIRLVCPHRPLLPPSALTAPTSLACPHQPRLPPPASLAPTSLACLHGGKEDSALVLGIGLRLWHLAFGFHSLSFIYKVHSFPSICIDRQFFIFSCSPSCSCNNRL